MEKAQMRLIQETQELCCQCFAVPQVATTLKLSVHVTN